MEYNVKFEEFADIKSVNQWEMESTSKKNECWYCTIYDRMFEGQGNKTQGKIGWANKRGLLQAFYNCSFWQNLVIITLKHNKINRENYPNWNDRNIVEQKIKKELFNYLIDSKIVKINCVYID